MLVGTQQTTPRQILPPSKRLIGRCTLIVTQRTDQTSYRPHAFVTQSPPCPVAVGIEILATHNAHDDFHDAKQPQPAEINDRRRPLIPP